MCTIFCTMLWYIVVQIYISKSVPYFVPCFVPCCGTLWYKYSFVKVRHIAVKIYIRKSRIICKIRCSGARVNGVCHVSSNSGVSGVQLGYIGVQIYICKSGVQVGYIGVQIYIVLNKLHSHSTLLCCSYVPTSTYEDDEFN